MAAPTAMTPRRRQVLNAVEWLLWAALLLLCAAFIAVKLRNWEPIERMPQDDFASYYVAATASAIDPHALYQTDRWQQLTGLNLRLGGPFPYAPTVALIFAPFVGMPYPQASLAWLLADSGLVLAIVALLVWRGRKERALMLGAGLWLLMPATWDNLYLGNINLVMALLITLGWVCFGSVRRLFDAASGFAIGMAASIKPFPLWLALLGTWTQRWAFLVGMAVGLPTAVFLGLVRYGPPVYAGYLDMLMQYYVNLAPPGASIVQNQSIMALGQKLAFAGELGVSVHEQAIGAVRFTPLIAPALARPLGLAASLLVAAITLWALWRFTPHTDAGRILGWTLLLTAMLMLAPVSWSMYVMLVPPLHPGLLLARRYSTPAWRLLLPLGYLLIIVQRAYALWLPRIPVMALTSTMLLGVTLWWAVQLRLAQRRQALAQPAASPTQEPPVSVPAVP